MHDWHGYGRHGVIAQHDDDNALVYTFPGHDLSLKFLT